MTRSELLTAAEVATLTGVPEAAVADWANARRIRPTVAGGQELYPATLVRFTHARDTQVARNITAARRLDRFIRHALLA